MILLTFACSAPSEKGKVPTVAQWETYELTLTAAKQYPNPYTDVSVYATFTSETGQTFRRPAFWDGGDTFKIRFAPPQNTGLYRWQTTASDTADTGLHDQEGALKAIPYQGGNQLIANGLLSMSEGKRSVVHASGKPFFLVGDTPWALPFRATKEQATAYAQFRQEQGFNAALLMTVQPDMEAEGPNARNTPLGFARGFDDLPKGHLNQLNPSYFHYLDTLIQTLISHEIVPVYQPVFHGFGWKGQKVLGVVAVPSEYERYTQYLLARYGSMPALWLLGADHDGKDPGVKEAGAMLEKWDCYAQPAGLHYNPCDDYVAEWAQNDTTKHCMHYNKSFQDAEWLDFQWAQTGHSGEHLYHKVARMYDNQPTKAVANGEPTYEGMGGGRFGLGWWQGEEAWQQLMHGGTMGVVYGAASLWQWKVSPEEAGWSDWAAQPLSWQGALKMEGARYVGQMAKILEGLALADLEKRWDLTAGKQPLLAKEGALYISYLENGGTISIEGLPGDIPYQWVNPKTGEVAAKSETSAGVPLAAPDNQGPWVLIVAQNL